MRYLSIAACLAVLPVTAFSQQAPDASMLQSNAAKDIGPYWSSTSFQIVSKKFNQDPLKPTYAARFQVAATNPDALYTPNGDKVGPEEVLVQTVPAKTDRTFYGTVDMAYSAGAWSGPIQIENPADKLGKPLDLYTVPTVVLGSDQYKQAVAQQTAFSLDQRKAEFQKQLDALQQSEAAKVADVQKSFEASLQNLNASFTDKLTQQQATLTAKLGDLLTQSRQSLADQNKAVEQSWTDLIAQQKAALAKLDLGLQITQDAVAAKIKLAKATVESQTQLIALQKEALANSDMIDSLKSKLAQKEQAQLVSFEGTWGGTLQCDKKVTDSYGIHATQMQLVLAKQAGGMLTGKLAFTGGDNGYGHGNGYLVPDHPFAASLQITNPNDVGAPQITITSAGDSVTAQHFLNFDVQLDPSGSLKGRVIHEDPKDCSVIFSR